MLTDGQSQLLLPVNGDRVGVRTLCHTTNGPVTTTWGEAQDVLASVILGFVMSVGHPEYFGIERYGDDIKKEWRIVDAAGPGVVTVIEVIETDE